MTTVFASLGAITELLSLALDLAVLLVGIQAVRTGLDILDRIIRAWRWAAGLAQLLLTLLCTAIDEFAPTVGRHLGRWAGRTVRLGRQARRWYDRHAAPTVSALVLAADRTARQFVVAQLGSTCPQLQRALRATRGTRFNARVPAARQPHHPTLGGRPALVKEQEPSDHSVAA